MLFGIMERKTLVPKTYIDISGKLSYSEHIRAWNTIRFKAELLKEFYQLKNRQSSFGYKMIYFRTFEDLENMIRKAKRNKEGLPVLMWMYEEKVE